MRKEELFQLPPDIKFFYPANIRIYRGMKWRFEKELIFARKEREEQELCHLSSRVVLENFETNEEIPGRIKAIYLYRLVGYGGKPYQTTSFLFRVKTSGGEEVLYPMWQRPKDLILKDTKTGRNFHFRA